jgi:hypothetical protein
MSLVNNQDAYVEYMIWDKGHTVLSVHGQPTGYSFLLRIPNFRGNYLSCVEELSVTLDGQPVDSSQVTFVLNNKRFAISELPELYDEYWECNTFARIEVQRPGGLCGEHEIKVVMRLRYAYSAYFGTCKVVTSDCARRLTY